MPELFHQVIPDGAHSGTRYAVMVWDAGDLSVTCEYAGPSLREARKAAATARTAEPLYDHIEIVQQTVTHTSWRPWCEETT